MHFAIESFRFWLTSAHNLSLQICCSCTYYSILYVSHISRWPNMPELEVSAAIIWTIFFHIEWLFWLIEVHWNLLHVVIITKTHSYSNVWMLIFWLSSLSRLMNWLRWYYSAYWRDAWSACSVWKIIQKISMWSSWKQPWMVCLAVCHLLLNIFIRPGRDIWMHIPSLRDEIHGNGSSTQCQGGW